MSTENIASSREQRAEQNDFATVRIPPNKRRSSFVVSTILIGFCIAMSGLFAGAELSRGLSPMTAIGASLLGNLILVIYAGLCGVIGTREGVSTAMLLRHPFGRNGSRFISAIFAFTLVGWYSWQSGFFGNTINAMFPGGGVITNPQVAAVWGGLAMMISAYHGIKGLTVLNIIAVPLLLIASIVGTILAVNLAGGWQGMMELPVEGPIDFQTAVVMVVGAFAVGGVIQSDITRYSKTPFVSMVATVIAFIGAHSFVLVAGYLMGMASGTTNVAMAMLQVIGVWSLLVLITAQWTTNDNNLYSSSLALSNIFKVPKKRIVLVLGTVASISAAFGLADMFVGWLVFLGVSIPPVAGILIADYYFISKRKYNFAEGTRYGSVSITAFSSWLIASIAGFNIAWGIQSINAVVISFAAYLVIDNLFRKMGWKRFIGKEHVELEDGNTKVVE
ncbi:MAG: cytosine permease [Spirochaetes bacterium]|nr:cytosine permease [Spirochaetota bacterium]